MSGAPPALARSDLLAAAALFVVALAATIGWRLFNGLWGALGTDAVLWGLTALDLRVGASPLVPPGYPALVGLVEAAGAPLVAAGWGTSMVATAAIAPAVMLAARRAGAAAPAAWLGGVMVLLSPDVAAWAQQVQPDGLAALGIIVLAGLLATAERPASAWSAAAIAGLLPLVREHGAPVAVIAIAVLLFTGRRGVGPAVAALATWWLSPLLVGVWPGVHPLDVPWGDRAGGALAALTSTDGHELSFLRELRPPQRAEYLALVAEGDRLGQIRWHASRSWSAAWDLWLWVGAAAVAAMAARSSAVVRLALPLAAAAPALVIWSQRRHVALLLPVAVATIAVGMGRRRLRAMLALVLVVVTGTQWVAHWITLRVGQRSERYRAESLAAIGGWLCENAPVGSLLGGVYQDIGLYCPLPRHDPDGTPADWNTFLVVDRPPRLPGDMQDRWEVVAKPAPGFSVYRLDPDREPRPCQGALPASGSAHLAIAQAHADLVGCDTPVR